MITYIGAGNVAWHLAPALEKAGFSIDAVYSRRIENAKALTAKLYHAEATNELNFDESPSEIFILAVPDDAILKTAEQLVLPEHSFLFHTSGTLSLDELQNTMDIHHDLPVECGVFYPLMTFSKEKKVVFDAIPFCIEAEEEEAQFMLKKMANSLSKNVQNIDSEERKILHLSAVFACNFTNHLWAISQEIIEANALDFGLLKPLIQETFQKAMQAKSIADVQTGPAIRADKNTIATHLELLADDADLTKIYQLLTKNIQTFFVE